jgi:lipoprotein NlpD
MRLAGIWAGSALGVALILAGCANHGRLAPVEERNLGGYNASNKPLPGAENAGKPGYYTVRQGDTLIRIGMDSGQSWRDLAKWNNMDNPNVIEVGQVLRVAPPVQEAVVVRPVSSGAVVAQNPASSPQAAASAAKPAASAASGAQAPASKSAASAPAAATTTSDTAEEALVFKWPAKGNPVAGFDESKNKGLDIAGNAGDPVLAAADGRVVYAGSGLRGYGNLIILKHNNTYLTAYAHNQSLLVKEDQTVKQGQKIAEMGNSDADQVKLHFEIRRQGKPVDPAKYLPAN